MKARIDVDGNLEVLRRGRWIPQRCPFDYQTPTCGDWCPMFLEDVVRDGKVQLALGCGALSIGVCYELVSDARPEGKDGAT